MTAERSRGWVVVAALALATITLSVVQPALLVFVPLALLLVALPPRRPVLLAIAMFIGWLVFQSGPARGSLWNFERGWALVLGAWFVLVVSVAPAWRFLTRAVLSVIGTAVTMCLLVAVNRGGLTAVDTAIGNQFREATQAAFARWTEVVGADQLESRRQALEMVTRLQMDLYPALLGLASVAALGLAWWLFNRVSRTGVEPFGLWRDLRFPDELVWLLIAGLITIVVPAHPLVHRAGMNVLTFMVGLYAVRGAAVLSVLGGSPGPLGYLLGAVIVVLMFPFVMATTLLVGLSDTWLDLRARRAASVGPGS